MKPIVDSIVASIPPPGKKGKPFGDDDASGPDDGDEVAAHSAMESFLTAIGVSPKKASAALKAFKELTAHCGGMDEADDEPEDEDITPDEDEEEEDHEG